MRLTPLSLAVFRERMARIRSSVARIANWNWLSNIVVALLTFCYLVWCFLYLLIGE